MRVRVYVPVTIIIMPAHAKYLVPHGVKNDTITVSTGWGQGQRARARVRFRVRDMNRVRVSYLRPFRVFGCQHQPTPQVL